MSSILKLIYGSSPYILTNKPSSRKIFRWWLNKIGFSVVLIAVFAILAMLTLQEIKKATRPSVEVTKLTKVEEETVDLLKKYYDYFQDYRKKNNEYPYMEDIQELNFGGKIVAKDYGRGANGRMRSRYYLFFFLSLHNSWSCTAWPIQQSENAQKSFYIDEKGKAMVTYIRCEGSQFPPNSSEESSWAVLKQ